MTDNQNTSSNSETHLTDWQHYRISAHAMGWVRKADPRYRKVDAELLELGYIEPNPQAGARLYVVTEAGKAAHDQSVARAMNVAREAATLASGTIASLIGVTDYKTIDRIQYEFVTFCRESAGFNTWQEAWDAFEWVPLIP